MRRIQLKAAQFGVLLVFWSDGSGAAQLENGGEVVRVPRTAIRDEDYPLKTGQRLRIEVDAERPDHASSVQKA